MLKSCGRHSTMSDSAWPSDRMRIVARISSGPYGLRHAAPSASAANAIQSVAARRRCGAGESQIASAAMTPVIARPKMKLPCKISPQRHQRHEPPRRRARGVDGADQRGDPRHHQRQRQHVRPRHDVRRGQHQRRQHRGDHGCRLPIGMCCETRLLFAAVPNWKIAEPVLFSAMPSNGVVGIHAWQPYAAQGTVVDGGGRQRNLTRRRKF